MAAAAAAAAGERGWERTVFFPHDPRTGKWPVIREVMQEIAGGTSVRDMAAFRAAVLQYNSAPTGAFSSLDALYGGARARGAEGVAFWGKTLPAIAKLVLATPRLFAPRGDTVFRGSTVPASDVDDEIAEVLMLRVGDTHTVSVTRAQAACIVANAFMSTWSGRHWQGSGRRGGGRLPSINFLSAGLFSLDRIPPDKHESHLAKLRCFVSYLHVAHRDTDANDTFISFERRQSPLRTASDLLAAGARCRVNAADFIFIDDGGVESAEFSDEVRALHRAPMHTPDDPFKEGVRKSAEGSHAHAMAAARAAAQFAEEVDFANETLGGGVLGRGAVQEEIRFCQAPELVVSRLICESLEPHEAVIIRGFEVFNDTEGYGGTFRFKRTLLPDWQTVPPTDDFARRRRSLIAIDAKYYEPRVRAGAGAGAARTRLDDDPPGVSNAQYDDANIVREIVKAVAGFHLPRSHPLPQIAPVVATGNWGAGAFHGDARLKVVIQVIAAALARRRVAYFTFHTPELLRLARAWLVSVDGEPVSGVLRALLSRDTRTDPRGPLRAAAAGPSWGVDDPPPPRRARRAPRAPLPRALGFAAPRLMSPFAGRASVGTGNMCDLTVARLGDHVGDAPAGTVLIPLRVRLANTLFAAQEVGLRIVVWSTELRADAGRAAEADVVLHGGGAADSGALDREFVVHAVLPARDGAWPPDARLWFGAHVFAPSTEGPIVGARAGDAPLSLRDLRDYVVVKDMAVPLQMRLAQAGLGEPYSKLTVHLVGVDTDAARARVRAWRFAGTSASSAADVFADATLPYHNAMLAQYVRATLFPFTDEAESRRLAFPPSHVTIGQLHAPTWVANVVVPQFAFWMQTGDRVAGADAAGLAVVLRTALDITLARHDWPTAAGAAGRVQAFTDTVMAQLRRTDGTYDERYTLACAVLCDTCALFSTQMFYKFDETYRVEKPWFTRRGGEAASVTRVDVESFHDAMAMRGGDCEDLASLIHRVFRWVHLGDPRHADGRSPYTEYGGWDDAGLSALQAMAYWYVSGGAVGAVNGARVEPGAGGVVPTVRIDDELDRCASIGGHMWNVMVPVPRMEALLRRMGNHIRLRGRGGAYPAWVKYTPVLIGEGTGALYPLVMPLKTYMYSAEKRAEAQTVHHRRLDAMRVIKEGTQVLARLQVQRWSDREEPTADARVNTFYREIATVYTDDQLIRGVPLTEFWYTRTAPRSSERDAPAPAPAPARFSALPGERDPGAPTWGVDVRDMILAANEGAYGDEKPSVALSTGPALQPDEAAAFKSRFRQLRPWELPRITAAARGKTESLFAGAVRTFQRDIDAVLSPTRACTSAPAPAPTPTTRINIVFRRNIFLYPSIRERSVQDVKRIAAKVARAEVELEYPADDLHSVRLSLWILA